MVRCKCKCCERVFSSYWGLSVHHQHNYECKAFHLDMLSKQATLTKNRKDDVMMNQESDTELICDNNVNDTIESEMSDNASISCNNDINLTTNDNPDNSASKKNLKICLCIQMR